MHLEWLRRWVPELETSSTILDLGCGSGHLAETLSAAPAAVVAVDLNEPGSFHPEAEWRYIRQDLNKDWRASVSSFAPAGYDVVLAFDILEHLEAPYDFLKRCADVLSPAGRLVVSTPNPLGWERVAFPRKWSGVRDPDHRYLFTAYTLKFLLQRAGLQTLLLAAPFRSRACSRAWFPRLGAQLLLVAAPAPKS